MDIPGDGHIVTYVSEFLIRFKKMSHKKLYTNGNLCSVITFAVIIRWAVSLHPYSGENSPPMFGDYEAQRHWMEITVNLPLKEWYTNTSNNDLLYWGLDYPPLTGYHSYVIGKVAHYVNPDFVKLHVSRGYESYDHKFFMRTTAILSEFIVYFTSVVLFFNSIYKNNQNYFDLNHGELNESTKSKTSLNVKSFNTYVSYLAQIAITLLYPGLVLIDHGHFQYNSVSLGFTVGAVTAIVYDKLLLSCLLFCLALNFKQMSLYHSLPFFIYMLSHCFPSTKSSKIKICIKRFISLSLTVILTFGIIWYPFLSDRKIFTQVVHRLFPLSRGIFEDKVSNIWCAINILYKLNKIFSQTEMAKICVACVLASSLPSLVNLFKHPTPKRLIISLVNVSLSFFLFSYQVHEKSILLVAMPILLYFPFDPFPCFWFLTISNFSMLPLFVKDKLLIPFISLKFLFTLFVFANVTFPITSVNNKLSKNGVKYIPKLSLLTVVHFAFKMSMLGCLLIFACMIFYKPPAQYPDIWPLLMSVYSCFHFCLFGAYFNYIQIFKLQN